MPIIVRNIRFDLEQTVRYHTCHITLLLFLLKEMRTFLEADKTTPEHPAVGALPMLFHDTSLILSLANLPSYILISPWP